MYKYYLTERPRSIATQPDGYKDWIDYDERTYISEIGRSVWGVLYYDRRLTPEEIERFELYDASLILANVLRGPTGDNEKDLKQELYGVRWAYQFFSNGTWGCVDLQSTDKTDKGESWAMGAYGNMKIFIMSGIAEEIYLLRDVDRQEAVRAANQRAQETGCRDMSILKEEIVKRALTIIDREYVEAQQGVRQKHYREGN